MTRDTMKGVLAVVVNVLWATMVLGIKATIVGFGMAFGVWVFVMM